MKKLLTLALLPFLVSCGSNVRSSASTQNDTSDSTIVVPITEETTDLQKRQFPSALDSGRFFEKEHKKFLYGGEEAHMHFDITDYDLKDEQFHFGIGREAFPALLEPEFLSIANIDVEYSDSSRFLLLKVGNTTKAYSIKDLTRHEVVNDIIEGQPVMAAYCILADLGAVYDRTINDKVFTFALSGYTYQDPEVWDGMDGFVMWDRETESLWWPLIGKAVSGKMQGTKMKVLDDQLWSQTIWKDIVDNHPDALILKSGQDFERPTSWKHYDEVAPANVEGDGVAPRWGENSGTGGND